jgi:hypothetical protein
MEDLAELSSMNECPTTAEHKAAKMHLNCEDRFKFQTENTYYQITFNYVPPTSDFQWHTINNELPGCQKSQLINIVIIETNL